jgi:hypothetical protein
MAVTAKFQADFASFQQAVQKAELSLKSFETGAGKVEKALNKMGDSFSGTKTIQDANLMATAIDKIGGASKLTESEQRRVNASVTEALAKYKALGLEAPAALQNLAKATAQIEPPLTLANRGANLLKSTFGQFTAANLAANAIGTVTDKVVEFAGKGSQLRGLEASFNSLSSGIKQDSGAMLSALQGGTRGLVANFDLLTSANKAMLLGLPVTVDTMGELAKTATTLGRAMGQDATKSLDDLITALGRSSPLILDNLGLTVKVGEANEAYAKKLGISAEAMTESQKKLAFYEAAMEAARKKTAELGEQTLTLSERMGQLWTVIENTVTKRASDMNVVLGKATESWKDFFQFIRDAAQFKSWDELAKKLEKPRQAGLPFIDPGALARESKAFQDEMAAVDKAFDESKRKAKAHAESIADLRTELSGKGTIRAAQDMVKAINGMTDATGKALPVWKLTRDTQDRINKVMEEALDIYRAQGVEAPAAIRAIAAATFDLSKLVPKIESGLPAAFAMVGKQAKMAVPEVVALYAAILDGLPKVVDGFNNLNLPGSIDLKKLKADFEKQFEDAGVKSGLAFGRKLSGAIVGAIQGGGNIGKSIGATLGDSIGSALGGNLAKAIGGTLGGALGGLIGPLGALGGQLLGGLFDKMFSKAGRNTVEDWVNSTFKGGFNELRTKLNDLGAEGERLWVNLTQKVGKGNVEQAKSAIKAIEDAFDAHKKKTEEVAAATSAAQQAAIDKVKGRIADLDSEYNSLYNTIKNEAPEDEMGVIERNTRAEMERIRKERQTAESELERITGAMVDSFEKVEEAAKAVAKAIYEIGGITGPKSPEAPESFANGSGGFRNFGSGKPAVLHGVEAVVRPQDIGGQMVINLQAGYYDAQRVIVDTLSRTYRLQNKVSAA